MTREQAIKILATLKAAYPNSYKGLTKEEANGVVNIWATQFRSIPYPIVSMAISKLISTNTFPPTISEVKGKMSSLYNEAWEMLNQHKQATIGIKITPEAEPIKFGTPLDENTLEAVNVIIQVCEQFTSKESHEPAISDLLGGFPDNALIYNDMRQIAK